MRQLILGTAGHIDHGKTTLVRALTGVDTDRLQEEKRRGITIDLGFAPLRLRDDLALGIVDLPGHEAFIRNMLAGASGIDLALLLIAADEGVMPQTREHLAILELLGVRGGVVAISKADKVEAEWLDLVLSEVAETLQKTSLAGLPLIPVSATTGEGIPELREALISVADSLAARHDTDIFRLPVDRVFPVHGTGTVVTGTVWSGAVERDQRIRLLPTGLSARVRSIQVHGEEVPRARAGQRAALGLAGIERQRIGRGDTLVDGEAGWEPSLILTAEFRLLDSVPAPLQNRTRVRFHLGTAEVMARVVLLECTELEPGETGLVQLRLEAPVVPRAGDRYVIRSYSPITTIGGGVIIEPLARKRNRVTGQLSARLRTLRSGGCGEMLGALADDAGWRGSRLELASIVTPFSPPEIAEVLASIDARGGAPCGDVGEEVRLIRVQGRIFATRVVDEARKRLLQALETFHGSQPLRPGMDMEELRRALPPETAPELGEWVIEELRAEGAIETRGPLIRETGFEPLLNEKQREFRDLLMRTLEEGGLAPPNLSALPAEMRDHEDLRQILRILEEEGGIVALTPDLVIARAILDKAVAETRRLLAGRGPLAAADFREALPVSRKYLIPLLEYLDRIGVTERAGDLRTVT